MKATMKKPKRERIELRVSCEVPEGMTKTRAKEMIVEAIEGCAINDPNKPSRIKVQFI